MACMVATVAHTRENVDEDMGNCASSSAIRAA